MYPVPKLVNDFFEFKKVIENKQDSTLNQYSYDLNKFFEYMINFKQYDKDIKYLPNKFIQSITKKDIFEYLKSISKKSPATRSARLSTLKSFFNYVKKETKLITENPIADIEKPKKQKKPPKYLSTEQQQQLLDVIDGEHKERDIAIITVFLDCGLRESELVQLNIKSINNDTLNVHGKGDKIREVPLSETCINVINNYLNVRPTVENDALFLSIREDYRGTLIQRISIDNVKRLVYKYLKKAGFEGYSCHKLRHSAATRWRENGADILEIKELLGHESVTTTQIYVHVNNKGLRNVVNRGSIGQLN